MCKEDETEIYQQGREEELTSVGMAAITRVANQYLQAEEVEKHVLAMLPRIEEETAEYMRVKRKLIEEFGEPEGS
jgi:hypothetical protein